MLDKDIEKRRTATIKRRLAPTLEKLGFTKDARGCCSRDINGHSCSVWLQKFRSSPLFRVGMTFHPAGGAERSSIVEFADKWTCKNCPGGRKYNFGFRWGEDAVEQCLREIHDFVQNVALPWFEERIRLHELQVRRAATNQ